jgi:hypothetical protein
MVVLFALLAKNVPAQCGSNAAVDGRLDLASQVALRIGAGNMCGFLQSKLAFGAFRQCRKWQETAHAGG